MDKDCHHLGRFAKWTCTYTAFMCIMHHITPKSMSCILVFLSFFKMVMIPLEFAKFSPRPIVRLIDPIRKVESHCSKLGILMAPNGSKASKL